MASSRAGVTSSIRSPSPRHIRVESTGRWTPLSLSGVGLARLTSRCSRRGQRSRTASGSRRTAARAAECRALIGIAPMNDHREPGKIILLNGPSSAGKSTLARALQQQLYEPFLHLSFDHLRASNVLPMARIRNGELDWARMRPAVFDGFHRCLSAFAKAGNNVIVDHIIEQERWLADLVGLLAPFDVFFVGVHCPLPELERDRKRV